jgi:two-component system sensor histidine kinase YesM
LQEKFDSLIGVLFVDLLEAELHDLMRLGGDSADIYLLDASGKVLSSGRQQEIGTVLAPVTASAEGFASDRGFFAGGGDSSRMLAYARVPGTLWYLLMPVPAGEMASLISAASTPSGTILLIGLLLLFALTFLLIFSTALDVSVRRINQIVYKLTAEGLGMPTGLKAKRRKEVVPIASLEENVRNMAAMIQQMVEETYDAQISIRNAELKALQAQINPHFLYNTLATIKWVVLDGDIQKAAMLVDTLSQYFRLSLNKGRDIVPLRDEYALIRKYLDIQLSRFPDKFTVDWDVDEGALECLLPKLSLQPIVENALQHGLKDWATGAGRIMRTAGGLVRCPGSAR